MPGHIYDGSTQIEGVIRIYDGSAWSDENDQLWAYDGSTWQLIQPYADSALNPPINLVVNDLGAHTATLEWDDPSQTITPTHVQVRIPEETVIWTEYDYGTQVFTWPTLEADTAYQFQVRYVLRVDGIVTLTSATASVFFTTDEEDAPSLPAPGPGGGSESTFTWPNTGNPGPVGGSDCWWEYIVQELDLEFIWIDTAVTGELDGDIGDWDVDLVAEGIECGTVCRLAYREVCNSIPGDWAFGGSFVVMCDYAEDCGGVATSALFGMDIWLEAILAMPQICYDDETEQQTIEDFITNQVYEEGPGYYAPGIVDGSWRLNGAPTNVETGSNVVAGYQSNLQDINETTDCSFAIAFLMTEAPSVGPFPSTKLLSIGKLFTVRANAQGAGISVSSAFPKDGGGAFNLVSTTELDLDAWHTAVVTIDVNGDKILYVDGVAADTDTATAAPAFQTLTSELELYINESGRLGPVGAWDRVLTADEVGSLFSTFTPYVTAVIAAGAAFHCSFDEYEEVAAVEYDDFMADLGATIFIPFDVENP